jgi:hypothetical protein
MMSRFKCSFNSKSEDCKQFELQKAGKDGVLVAVQNAAPKKAHREDLEKHFFCCSISKDFKNFLLRDTLQKCHSGTKIKGLSILTG